MLNVEILQEHLGLCLEEGNFPFLGTRIKGKVRDSYVNRGRRILVTTDRLSCFDVIVTAVPFKGQVLNRLALYWFEETKDIIPNHVIASPDPNVIVGKECQVLPIEVVVRGYLAGSAWRDYEAGKAISGVTLPKGLKKSAKLENPILTPSTKALQGDHDTPISEEEIVSKGIVSREIWGQVSAKALQLFNRGQQIVNQRGLILVDTKYEFGLLDGELYLVDEIHTLDSSRYWVGSEYEERFESGADQHMLDKEPTRQWLISKGFMGEGPIPEFTPEHRIEIAKHYINSFEMISGQEFVAVMGDPMKRIEGALRGIV